MMLRNTAREIAVHLAYELSFTALPVEEPKTVLLDRPFLYAIWDTEANLPVFLGTLTDPAAAQ